ncbi:DUF397 domain-containing protein [Streptomyces sp. NPDC003247]|uniref:DUF397 domain-containing protein n=1 Tax=Streptomyces sp. NPDC003247 TaxID=3364677 RepID=UPI00369492B3
MAPIVWQKSSYCAQGEACVHVAATAQKSSYCQEGDACVHVAATAQKSSYCAQGESCVHISAAHAPSPATIHLTESADPTGAVLSATPAAFAALLASVSR